MSTRAIDISTLPLDGSELKPTTCLFGGPREKARMPMTQMIEVSFHREKPRPAIQPVADSRIGGRRLRSITRSALISAP
jgi:hypothetical protein